jgi:hypothetical protein
MQTRAARACEHVEPHAAARLPYVAMTPPPPTDSIDPTSVLQQLFESHGVAASRDGEWVTLGKPYTRCRAAVVNETPHPPDMLVIQLDVCVFIGFGPPVMESFAGIGRTRDEAIHNAFAAFAQGSLHVLLAAAFKPSDENDPQVDREQWTIDEVPRDVIIGGAIYKGLGELPKTLDLRWVEQFREQLARQPLPRGTHWVRIYRAQDSGRTMEIEVLLDNDTWPAMQKAAAGFEWPKADGFASVRLFLIIRDQDRPAGPDVAELAGIIARMPGAGDDAVFDELVRRGASEVVAEQAIALIPLAFGRALLAQMGSKTSVHCILIAKDKQQRTLRLDRFPMFREAMRLANDASRYGTAAPEAFSALAMRSVEVIMLNKMLHAGSKAQNLVMTPPAIIVVNEWEADAGPSATLSAATTTATTFASPKKPWWKFWT